MPACSEQARLFEAHWDDWHASGVKAEKRRGKTMAERGDAPTARNRRGGETGQVTLPYNSSGAEKLNKWRH